MFFLTAFMMFFAVAEAQVSYQFDGEGGPGKVLRAYVINGSPIDATLVPGTEHNSGEAVYPIAEVSLVSQQFLKIVGKGVKGRGGEAVAFACIGAQSDLDRPGPSCDYLRALYYNPRTRKTFAFGRIFYRGDTDLKSFFESMRHTEQQVGVPRITYNKFISFYSDELSSKEGWSWSTNPERVPYGRFLSMVAELQGSSRESVGDYSRVEGKIFNEMIQPKNPFPFSRWYSPTGGHGPNGGYYSVYQFK